MEDSESDRQRLQGLKSDYIKEINRLAKMPVKMQLNYMLKLTTAFLELFSGKEIKSGLMEKARGISSRIDDMKYSGKIPEKMEIDSALNDLRSVISEFIQFQLECIEKKKQGIHRKGGLISVMGGLLKPKEMDDMLVKIESLIGEANAAIGEGNVRGAKYIYNRIYVLYMGLETGLKRRIYRKVKQLFEKLASYQK